jgi:hypothetical protein
MNLKQSSYIIASLIIILCLIASSHSNKTRADEKMTAEEVVAKHLESIGSAEERASVKSRVIVGVSRYVRRGPGGGSTEGRAVLASENEKNMIGMKFGVPGYDIESVAFDGKDLTVGYIAPGVRSPLEQFFRNHESTFKHGLLGGALSSAWSLLSLDDKKAKLKYSGVKKIEGTSLHQMKYQPRKGSDLEVTLFFEADSFRHVRTEYSRVVSANIGPGGVDSSAAQRETRYKFVETFADFRKEGNLTLPHDYRIRLEISSIRAIDDEWNLTLTDFIFNQTINPTDFIVDVPLKKGDN